MERARGYVGEDEVKVSLMWVSSSVSDEQINRAMAPFGKVKSMTRLRDREDGLENGSVLLVFDKRHFRPIPARLAVPPNFRFLVRHEGQPALPPASAANEKL